MKLKCIRCDIVRELTPEELRESGEFVQARNLGAVGFLKVLSLDMRDGYLCANGKNHEWEFEEGFDKDIHELAARVKSAIDVVKICIEEENECDKLIDELTEKKLAASYKCDENMKMKGEFLEKMKEIAYIGDEKLWS